jgi:hypothetical protein
MLWNALRTEITSAQVRWFGNGLGAFTCRKLQTSISPRCGFIHVIPSLTVKCEQGNYVIMALAWFSLTGTYNERVYDLSYSLTLVGFSGFRQPKQNYLLLKSVRIHIFPHKAKYYMSKTMECDGTDPQLSSISMEIYIFF